MNDGQSTGPAGVDIDVMPSWKNNITGRGVVVSILDDGVDHTHPDLRDNFVSLIAISSSDRRYIDNIVIFVKDIRCAVQNG